MIPSALVLLTYALKFGFGFIDLIKTLLSVTPTLLVLNTEAVKNEENKLFAFRAATTSDAFVLAAVAPAIFTVTFA